MTLFARNETHLIGVNGRSVVNHFAIWLSAHDPTAFTVCRAMFARNFDCFVYILTDISFPSSHIVHTVSIAAHRRLPIESDIFDFCVQMCENNHLVPDISIFVANHAHFRWACKFSGEKSIQNIISIAITGESVANGQQSVEFAHNFSSACDLSPSTRSNELISQLRWSGDRLY